MTVNEQRDQINHNFAYHAPTGPDQVALYAEVRRQFRELALYLVYNTPQSREQSLALTNLETAVMWANAAIARAT